MLRESALERNKKRNKEKVIKSKFFVLNKIEEWHDWNNQ